MKIKKQRNVKIYTVLQEKMIKNYCKGIFQNLTKIWHGASIRNLVAIFKKSVSPYNDWVEIK